MLIEILPEIHGVELDIAYATDRNITGAPIYSRAACYLHPEAFAKLERARDLASAQGFGLKIFDAFRPPEAQWALWNFLPDPNFISDPRRGGPHSRGVAVDLTLTDKTNGEELDMGGPFDDPTSRGHHGCTDISVTAQRNRSILVGIMSAAGWDFYMNEWWHYQLFNARQSYPLVSDTVLPISMMR